MIKRNYKKLHKVHQLKRNIFKISNIYSTDSCFL